MTFLLKNIATGITAGIIWYMAEKLGFEPRVLDFFLLFLLEYGAISKWVDDRWVDT